MKRLTWLLLTICMLFSYGCAAVTYTAPDGTRVEYVRFMTSSDKIVGNIGQAAITVSGQEIDVELLKALISAAAVVK
jgi:hypothetical protein